MKIRAFRYTPEMVDCHYCTEYTRKPPHCKVTTCTCIAERIEAGVVGYREAVSGCFAGKTAISDRLQTIVESFPNSLWLDAAHRERMEHLKAVLHFYRKRNTPKWYAALYLLSSSENLHRRTINCFTKKTIEFSKAQLSGISPADYALVMAARTIYTGEARITTDELADPEVVDDETFRLIVNARLIAKYGLPVMEITEKDGSV